MHPRSLFSRRNERGNTSFLSSDGKWRRVGNGEGKKDGTTGLIIDLRKGIFRLDDS